jgi:acyl-CoA synthetase (AMP-forming)/AMP-acid ligase II
VTGQESASQPAALRDLLLRRAAADPGSLAFADHGTQLTFAELGERASARAATLQRTGVAPGDRIAITMSPGLPLIEVFWALQLIGGVPCIFNPAVPGQTLARRVDLVRPRLVVTDELAGDMRSSLSQPADTDIGPDDLAFLQLTSGTSGAPRASMMLHRNLLTYLQTSRGHRELGPGDVLVSWVPPWHDLGFVTFVVAPVYHGASCHVVEPRVWTIPEWLATISRVGGTYTAAPDFALRLAVRMVDPDTVDLSALRFITVGAEPVRSSTIEKFERTFVAPGVVAPGYGLGEATLGVTEHSPGDRIAVDERGNVSCGTANDGVELRAGLSLESPDEIRVKALTVFAGYFDAPEETQRTLRDGWLHTGDSGYLDGAGRLFVLGRREGMIKRAGAVIAPRELEEAAERVPGVRIAAATGVSATEQEDDMIVVAVAAHITPARSAEQISADVSREIVAALDFAPGQVRILPRRAIPRTENGKIRHAKLRELLDVMARQPT